MLNNAFPNGQDREEDDKYEQDVSGDDCIAAFAPLAAAISAISPAPDEVPCLLLESLAAFAIGPTFTNMPRKQQLLDVLSRCTFDVVRLKYVRHQRVYRPWGDSTVRTKFNSCVRTASQSGGRGDFGAWQIVLSGASPKYKDRARHSRLFYFDMLIDVYIYESADNSCSWRD